MSYILQYDPVTGHHDQIDIPGDDFGEDGAPGPEGPAGPEGPPGPAAVLGYAKVSDQKAQNTNGGTFTAGAWTARVLNTVEADSDDILSLSANQIVLEAGTYIVRGRCPAYGVDRHQARLQNVTAGTTLVNGSSGFTNSANFSMVDGFISGEFTVDEEQTLELQHRCQTTSGGTYGYGQAANLGTEVYAELEFWKVA